MAANISEQLILRTRSTVLLKSLIKHTLDFQLIDLSNVLGRRERRLNSLARLRTPIANERRAQPITVVRPPAGPGLRRIAMRKHDRMTGFQMLANLIDPILPIRRDTRSAV